jgi:hypothetical protein
MSKGAMTLLLEAAAVRASSHRFGQKWSLAFWLHNQRPNGIVYPSRLNEEINLALYDAALPNVRVSTTATCQDGAGQIAVLSSVHESLDGERRAVVIAHLEETPQSGEIRLSGVHRAMLYRPFEQPQELRLPLPLSLPADGVAVLVADR